MEANKLYIVMVGLPARGKSTIANRIKETLQRDNIQTEIFNNGDLRRQLSKEDTSYAGFYSSENTEAAALREKIAFINIHKAISFLNNKNGDVAILDATNISSRRRLLIREKLVDHPILFIECQNPDQEILEASISRKAQLPEFNHLSYEEALASFKERISYYEHIRTPLIDEPNFIILDTLNNKILQSEFTDTVPHIDRLRDLLLTDLIKNLYLVRHGETYYNLQSMIGGDSSLTPKGMEQAETLAQTFKTTSLPYIFTSNKKRTLETARPICDQQENKCDIIALEEFNEIDSGVCESMSYAEIQAFMPEVHKARFQDKYNYVYPEGEGYVTMEDRINKGIKKTIFWSGNVENIMIVGHRAVNRMILAHFLFRRKEDVPYIFIPQDKYFHIVCTQEKKLFELKPLTNAHPHG